MTTPRHVLLAVAATALLVPAGSASASADGVETVRSLATEAASTLAEEVTLLGLADPARAPSPAEREDAAAELRAVDGRGQSLLIQLQGLGVQLTPAIESTLDRLPQPTEPGSVPVIPQAVVYDAAIDDLLRIASTPTAVAPVGDRGGGPSSALLVVAAMSLVILGAVALTNTLWRRPEHDDLEALAWSDSLTGLANRRRLDHDLDLAHEGPTSVIMIDVDHFQGINDAFGHQAGDDILRRLGTLFSHHVRIDDVVYRYGGEEFCVLLPGADADEARLVADRIVESARTVSLPNGANVTVSIGIAGATGQELPEAVEIADRALYAAKQQGRDRAVHADEAHLVPG